MKTVSKDYNFSIHHSFTTLKTALLYIRYIKKVTVGKSGYYRLKGVGRRQKYGTEWNVVHNFL